MIKIVSGPMGNHLAPPNFPTHNFHVATSGDDGSGYMALDYAVSDDTAWMNGNPQTKAVRLAAGQMIKDWAAEKPAIDSQPVQDWIKAVFAHMAHCWRFEGMPKTSGPIVGRAAVSVSGYVEIFSMFERTVSRHVTDFASLPGFILAHYLPVLHVRKYYPEYSPEFSPADYADFLWCEDKERAAGIFSNLAKTAKICTMASFMAADDASQPASPVDDEDDGGFYFCGPLKLARK